MTQDEKSHIQTQVTRDLQIFANSVKIRAQKTHGVTLSDDEAKALIAEALKETRGPVAQKA